MGDEAPWYEQLFEVEAQEFKSPAPWGKIKHHLMREAIAMSNADRNGIIVVGVKKVDGEFKLLGLGAQLANTYREIEAITTQIAECAYPNLAVQVRLEPVPGIPDKQFAVFRVERLGSVPHVAVRTLLPRKQGLQHGVLYVRTAKPSAEPANPIFLRELWNRVEPMIAGEFNRKMGVAGCPALGGGRAPEAKDDGDLFEKESDF